MAAPSERSHNAIAKRNISDQAVIKSGAIARSSIVGYLPKSPALNVKASAKKAVALMFAYRERRHRHRDERAASLSANEAIAREAS
jgi:hypothetical protein